MSDRLLLFSQSLFTLNLLEEFLQQRSIPGNKKDYLHHVSTLNLSNVRSDFNYHMTKVVILK